MTGFGYFVHAPPPQLASGVDYLWTLSDAPAHSTERVIPSGTVELVVNLNEDGFGSLGAFRGAVVSGAYSRAFVIETRTHASIIGVHFKPGGAGALLGIPPGALADTHVELEALWGRGARELRERLCGAADTVDRVRILREALVASFSRSRRGVGGEVAFALTRLGAPGVEVRQVAKEVELSHRRFIQLFTEQVGMTPQRYARVRRFQQALRRATGRGSPAWTETALCSGYFDQAHLCREWLEFTGLSPAEFLRLRNIRVKDNHVALPDPGR